MTDDRADRRPERHRSDNSSDHQVDWGAIDADAQRLRDTRDPTDTRDDVLTISDTRSSAALLDRGDPLDPARARISVPDLYPNRFDAPTGDQVEALRTAWLDDPRPGHWVDRVNPGADSPGRWTNCADCARAVQSTIDGNPTVASEIGPDGLPLRSADGPILGEEPDYTEQWSADRAVPMSYEQIADAVRQSGGSAIVFGYSAEGGHAFNVVADGHGDVQWIDGQLGEVGEWPPPYADTFDRTEAILFPHDTARTPRGDR